MAETWGSRQLRHERAMDARLIRELRELGQAVGRIVMRHATGRDEAGQAVVPNTRAAREALRRDIWREALKPYFIGSGDEALDGPIPRSPYTRLMVEGIKGAVDIQAARQVAIVRQACKDEVVLRWLTTSPPAPPHTWRGEQAVGRGGLIREQGPRGVRKLSYDPYHLFVDPNGYRLSDRVWNTGGEVRRRIDQVLDYQIPRHMAAVDIATRLEQYMTPEAARMRTTTPYGVEGSYAARRLARTEITAAAGRSVVSANLANPYVDGTDWALSASHPGKGPEPDICDDLCTIDKAGVQVRDPYPNDGVPAYPPHPHCFCTLRPVVTRTPAQVTAEIRAEIQAATPRAMRLRGAFNPDWLSQALLAGTFLAAVLGWAEAEAA